RAELRLRPREPQLLMDLANLFMDAHYSRPAVTCLHRLTSIEPRNAAAWQNLAVAQFLSRRYTAGIASCTEALRLEPSLATAMYTLPLALAAHGTYSEPLVGLRRAAAIEPHDLFIERLELRIRLLAAWRGLPRTLGSLRFWT